MNSQKIRQHKLVEKSPAFAAILMCLMWFVVYQLVEIAINLPLSFLLSGYDGMTGPIGLIGSIAIMMGVYKWWFRPEFEGMLKGNLPLGFLLGLIELGYLLLSFVFSVFTGYELSFKPLTAAIVFVSLGAGMAEELAFRGVLHSTLMRQWKDRNKFWTAALVSGIFFGLIHATNVFAGADPLRTIVQVVESVGVGAFFSAVYLRSGSILPCMFYHTLHDIIAIAGESEVTESGIITAKEFNLGDGLSLLLSLVLLAISIWLIRPSKNEEMREIWNRKWKPAAVIPEQEPAAVIPEQEPAAVIPEQEPAAADQKQEAASVSQEVNLNEQ